MSLESESEVSYYWSRYEDTNIHRSPVIMNVMLEVSFSGLCPVVCMRRVQYQGRCILFGAVSFYALCQQC